MSLVPRAETDVDPSPAVEVGPMAFHLLGTMTVPARDLERVRAVLPEHILVTRAEPGCRSFRVEEQGEGVFLVSEEFTDRAAFEAHQERLRGTPWAAASANAIRSYKTWET